MPLNSFKFALFFLVVYGLYLILPRRGRNILLLLASYCFYSFWDYRFLALILISTTVDFWVARRIAATEIESRRRGYLLVSLVTNLSILGFFKYFNFLVDSASDLLGLLGLDPVRWHLNLIVPIGISFYTFKTLSYTIGVFGRELEPTRSWVNYAAFVSFFPQLLSGPIDRASALLPQIEEPRTLTRDLIRTGIWLFFWGLFKKVVVADNLSDVVSPAFSPSYAVSTAYAWTAIYAFAMQLYCDFSGYTDMARGVAMLLGFQTAINFRNPFFASNPVEFWQRWHISLSRWIQDYMYFPLAAHALRKGSSAWHQYLPHILIMVAIGLWHGANMTYVLFGLYWGVAVVAYNAYRAWWKQRLRRAGRKPVARQWPLYAPRRLASMVILFHVVCLSFVFFRAESVGAAFHYLRVLFDMGSGGWLMNGFGLAALNVWLVIALLCAPVLFMQVHQEVRGDPLSPLGMSLGARVLWGIALLVMLLMLGKTNGGAFIYVQF